LSSTVLSDTIKTTLKKEPTRIEISIQSGNEKKQLIFEGPNIKESREKIEAPLNDLTKGHQGNVDIVAKRKHMPLGSTPPLRSRLPVQLTNMDLEPRRSLAQHANQAKVSRALGVAV
jgi:hypothetical protein